MLCGGLDELLGAGDERRVRVGRRLLGHGAGGHELAAGADGGQAQPASVGAEYGASWRVMAGDVHPVAQLIQAQLGRGPAAR